MTRSRESLPTFGQIRSGGGVLGSSVPLSGLPASGRNPSSLWQSCLDSVQRHRLLALGIVLIGLALSVAYGVWLWPVYTAQSQIYLQPTPRKVIAQPLLWPSLASTYDSFLAQQLQNATHPDVRLAALHKLKAGSWKKTDESEAEAAERLGRAVTVARVGNSDQIAVTANAGDATQAANLANAMAASLIESESSQEKAGDEQRLTLLRAERSRVLTELRAERVLLATEQRSAGQPGLAPSGAKANQQNLTDRPTEILRLQGRLAQVEEQLDNLTLEDAAPGAAYLSIAAVPPSHPKIVAVLLPALLIALSGMVLALLAALLASALDNRVYSAADLERALGFAPLAQLPDFDEVNEGVAEEHLLRLSTAIEDACQQGTLKSCIFTGVTAGAGVTTVSTRVRTMLQSLGRSAILIDAVGMPLLASSSHSSRETFYQLARSQGGRSQEHSQAGEPEEEESLVLIDATPLRISGETQHLARSVDAVLVVVESGVATGAQLRAVVQTLQRLDVKVAGFVLNRIGLQNADRPFRQSIRESGRFLKTRERSTARRTERSFVRESLLSIRNDLREGIGPQPHVPERAENSTQAAATPGPAQTTVAPRLPSVDEPRRAVAMPQEEQAAVEMAQASPASESGSESRIDSKSESRPAPERNTAPVAAPKPSTEPQPLPEQAQSGKQVRSTLFERSTTGQSQDPALAEAVLEEFGGASTTRLGGLGNLSFAGRLKKLQQRADAQSVAPLWDRTEEPRDFPSHEIGERPLPPPAQRVSVHVSPTLVTAPPEFLPPRPMVETTDQNRDRAGITSSRRDRRNAIDEVEVLPSWRGQYRRR